MRSLVVFFCLMTNLFLVGAGASPQAAEPGAAAKPAPEAIPLSGKVLETMDGGGYTYVLLKTAKEKVWVAAPLMKVTVGQDLALLAGYEIKNFTSKALNRKFDRVVFSAGVVNSEIKLSPSALKMAHQGVPMPAGQGAASGAGAAKPAPAAQAPAPAPKNAVEAGKAAVAAKANRPAPVSIEQVAKAKGKNAYTIAQLYAKKEKLEKKPIVVRGRVVKVSARILKRNWIHIQDGSGSEAKKTNNLILTSKELPKVGDLVTAKGTLYNNQDFGSGYRYGLIVEGVTFK